MQHLRSNNANMGVFMRRNILFLLSSILFLFSLVLHAEDEKEVVHLNYLEEFGDSKTQALVKTAEEYYFSGQAYLEKNDILKASGYLQKSANIFHQLGDKILAEGKSTHALMFYLIALELDPLNASLYKKAGDIWYDQASESPNQVTLFEYSDKLGVLQVNVAPLLFQKAHESYEKALLSGLNDAEIHFKLGIIHHHDEDSDIALKNFLTAIDLGKKTFDSFYNAGICYFELDQLDTALAYFEKALTLDPLVPHVYSKLAEIWKQKSEKDRFGKKKKLLKALEYAIKAAKLKYEQENECKKDDYKKDEHTNKDNKHVMEL